MLGVKKIWLSSMKKNYYSYRQKVKKLKKKHITIPLIIIVGLIVASIFYWIYGGKMLGRYVLGGLMFATITIFFVTIIQKMTKGKGLKLC